MQMTKTQLEIARELQDKYGTPSMILISPELNGVIRLDWCKQQRHLFINPDGSRAEWMMPDPGVVS